MAQDSRFARVTLKLSITLAVIMIVLVVVLLVGTIITNVFAAKSTQSNPALYWVFLSLGSVFLSLVLAGTITYLVLSIKMVNLNRRQSNFIDSVTHELKSPLASLKLCIQTLTRYDVSPQEKLRFYEGMMEEVERLDLLINQVLRAGQLEAGLKIGDEPEEVNLCELLEGAARSVTVLHHLPPEKIQITCDPNVKITASRILLEMIFRNLLDNGIKYGGESPLVRVQVRQDGSRRLIVKITDNGPGIPKKMRKKVFQRFVRLGGELERRKKGTGLGLYIVMRCLRLLRGTIRVRPNKTGPGTSFFVFLPIETPENS